MLGFSSVTGQVVGWWTLWSLLTVPEEGLKHACWSVCGKAGIERALLLGGSLLLSHPTLPQASACLLHSLDSPVDLFHSAELSKTDTKPAASCGMAGGGEELPDFQVMFFRHCRGQQCHGGKSLPICTFGRLR